MKVKEAIVVDARDNSKKMDLSSGIGLALLSKALGILKIEDKYLKHINNIRKTKLMQRMDMRIRV